MTDKIFSHISGSVLVWLCDHDGFGFPVYPEAAVVVAISSV